jgi:hypothetical protein
MPLYILYVAKWESSRAIVYINVILFTIKERFPGTISHILSEDISQIVDFVIKISVLVATYIQKASAGRDSKKIYFYVENGVVLWYDCSVGRGL